MAEPLVVFDNVVKRFGTFEAVKRMNFEIHEGEFLAFMGPSGCGKTTTLRMLAGLEDPSEGDIRLDGKSLVGTKPHERDTPMVWQSLALFPFLNARENVEFGLKMRGQDAASRKRKAQPIQPTGRLRDAVKLPFDPTGAQRRSVMEMSAAISSSMPSCSRSSPPSPRPSAATSARCTIRSA